MIESNRTAAEEDETECQSRKCQRELVPVITDESIVKMDFGDGDRQINADGKSCRTSKKSNQNQDAAEEFRKGGKIGGPGRQAEAGNKLSMVMKAAEYFGISVSDHDGAESEAHHQ